MSRVCTRALAVEMSKWPVAQRKWPIEYIDWRLTTAYPKGWKFALLHPLILIKDLWRYLEWCQKIDEDIK